MTARLRVAVVYPELLGTYGDGGNGVVLARRAAWRGVTVELLHARADRPLPTADIYCLGGGEDAPQARAADSLSSEGVLARAVQEGAVVLAVCAGYQIIGQSFPAADGTPLPGVGLLDVATVRSPHRRAVGEVLATPTPSVPVLNGPGSAHPGWPSAPVLTGFENHAGATTVGPGAHPLATVIAGVGNGDGTHTEGAWSGHVLGTYLHGPFLARNPAIADLLLAWSFGADQELAPLDDGREEALRAERVEAVRPRRIGVLARSWRQVRGHGRASPAES